MKLLPKARQTDLSPKPGKSAQEKRSIPVDEGANLWVLEIHKRMETTQKTRTLLFLFQE